MTGNIVVGVDGSKTAQQAAESARDLAVALGTTLYVVTAFDSDRTEVFGSGSDQWLISDVDEAETWPSALLITSAPEISGSITLQYAAHPPTR